MKKNNRCVYFTMGTGWMVEFREKIWSNSIETVAKDEIDVIILDNINDNIDYIFITKSKKNKKANSL
jgi:ATP:corrinoid adenosyltransferase